MKPRALHRYKTGKHRGKQIPHREIRRRQEQSLIQCGLLRKFPKMPQSESSTEFVE